MKSAEVHTFLDALWTYYDQYGRHDLPWRLTGPDGNYDAYGILVSELMLQQTQVGRVIPKFQSFMERFPTLQVLAAAPLSEVLIAWTGLGYNRRAKYLQQAAQLVVHEFDGDIPDTLSKLLRLPGVGSNTAGAILAYAYNQPVNFVETNIRTVYIHHFFHDSKNITDAAILCRLDETLDHENPRLFYWALMDYGTHLKQTIGNLNKLSKSYTKQTQFEGSLRQIRGRVIRLLSEGPLRIQQLQTRITDERLPTVLADLSTEGLIEDVNGVFQLAGDMIQ